MNIPNLITILRILLIPVFIILLLYNHFSWALAVFAFCSVTDGLDGFIARNSNQRTVLGTYLDPMADKLLLISGFVTLSFLKIIPLWITIVLVSRDLILLFGTLILHMIQGYIVIEPSWLGKCTTVMQMICILAALVFMVSDRGSTFLFPFLLLAVALTVVSGLHYIYRAIRFMNAHDEHYSRP